MYILRWKQVKLIWFDFGYCWVILFLLRSTEYIQNIFSVVWDYNTKQETCSNCGLQKQNRNNSLYDRH